MTDRIHVTMTLDLVVEDENAMRESAYGRMREAWTSDDDFPFGSPADVPLDQVIHSLLADALPADLPGCRRSQLDVEAEGVDSDGEQAGNSQDKESSEDHKGEAASDEGASTDANDDSSDDNASTDDTGDSPDQQKSDQPTSTDDTGDSPDEDKSDEHGDRGDDADGKDEDNDEAADTDDNKA